MINHKWFCKFWLSSVSIASSVVLGALVSANPAIAQPISDGTLGTNVSPESLIRGILSNQIDGGTIRGSNLFHSFRDFNVGKERGVYFSNPSGIQNIFSRVTGRSNSEINGRLGVLGGANLFLANPNGIVFGPNARLDVSGSFVGSTASGITFADGTQFRTADSSATLTISTPLGLQFGDNPGPITLTKANLSIPPGQTLALVGGNVTIKGGAILAPGGRIEIGSVASNSLVSLSPESNGLALGYKNVKIFQDILVSEKGIISANEPKGSITLQGRNVSLQSGAQISTSAFGTGEGGDIIIRASELIDLTGSVLPAFTSNNGNTKTTTTTTKTITTTTTTTTSGSTTTTTTTTITTPSSDDSRSGVFSRAESSQSKAGNITLEAQKLRVRDNALVSASTVGQGKAGNIIIRSPSSVELDFGGIFAQVLEGAQAAGGSVSLETKTLDLKRGSIISVSNLGRGVGGNLSITASDVFLGNRKYLPEDIYFSQGGQLKAETASGSGGNISLNVQNLLLLRLGSLISATAGAGGDGGNVVINAPFIVALPNENSDIRANAGDGNGGKVTIFAQELFGIRAQPFSTPQSDITASSTNKIAGTVTVATPDLKLVRAVEELPGEVPSLPEIAQGCASSKGRGGRFSIKNSDKLPSNPVEILIDPPSVSNSNSPPITHTNATSNFIVEAQGWVRHPTDPDIVFLKVHPNVTARIRSNSSCDSHAL